MKLAVLLALGIAAPPAPQTASKPLPSALPTSSAPQAAPQAPQSEGAADGALPRVGVIPGLVVDPPEPDAPPPPNAAPKAGRAGVDARDLAATSADPAMRRYLAAVLAQQTDVHSFVLLAQLASDGDVGVRRAVLNAVYTKRCKREPPNLCTALLASFTHDPDRDVAWQARDWLLDRDLELALEDADKEYKLDLLAKLGGSPVIPPGPARHLLRCLSTDADNDIQDNAAWLLEQQP
jgi:hypothetical protein